MGKFLILILILLGPVSAAAHPGKTDSRGGHKCWRGCGSWELNYGEYHLHDEEYRPIHLNARKTKAVPPGEDAPALQNPTISEPAKGPAEPGAENREKTVTVKEENIVVHRNITTVYDENILPFNPLYLVLSAFLLLFLLLFLRRRGKG